MKMNEKQKEYTVTLIKKYEKQETVNGIMAALGVVILMLGLGISNIPEATGLRYDSWIDSIMHLIGKNSVYGLGIFVTIMGAIGLNSASDRRTQLEEQLELDKLADEEPEETKGQSR